VRETSGEEKDRETGTDQEEMNRKDDEARKMNFR
jgi:hypothetical protein